MKIQCFPLIFFPNLGRSPFFRKTGSLARALLFFIIFILLWSLIFCLNYFMNYCNFFNSYLKLIFHAQLENLQAHLFGGSDAFHAWWWSCEDYEPVWRSTRNQASNKKVSKELGGKMVTFILPILYSFWEDILYAIQWCLSASNWEHHAWILQVNAFRERRALSLTLNDTKTAVDKLHQMANVVVGIIVFGLWLLILGIATTHFFVLISSQMLLAVFMFGNTLKTTFEAIIFLFVMHPFDVGDRCEIEGVQVWNIAKHVIMVFHYYLFLRELVNLNVSFSDGSWGDEYIDNSISEVRQHENHIPKQFTVYQTYRQHLSKPRYGRFDWLLCACCHSGTEACHHERSDKEVYKNCFWF